MGPPLIIAGSDAKVNLERATRPRPYRYRYAPLQLFVYQRLPLGSQHLPQFNLSLKMPDVVRALVVKHAKEVSGEIAVAS